MDLLLFTGCCGALFCLYEFVAGVDLMAQSPESVLLTLAMVVAVCTLMFAFLWGADDDRPGGPAVGWAGLVWTVAGLALLTAHTVDGHGVRRSTAAGCTVLVACCLVGLGRWLAIRVPLPPARPVPRPDPLPPGYRIAPTGRPRLAIPAADRGGYHPSGEQRLPLLPDRRR